ncbi:OsmC family protein [Crenobacter cavernae]|uniref:OsmC family peroxiredoxin n=1 Tax=Crenobacter cavernae TaxID=2290923 RepID=A0ABY0FA31_9NEIS|nr:OsmC family protein [Crenobacter cavernae]RXZ42518.1 OsmC family peroxiredoxin [Crenobacter cavernae]
MITTTSEAGGYRTRFDNGHGSAIADTPHDKDGGRDGFGPHELIEAALATCMNMTARMVAEARGIALEAVTVTVTLDRSRPDEAVYDYEVELAGTLTDAERRVLRAAIARCPVRKTLARQSVFREKPASDD